MQCIDSVGEICNTLNSFMFSDLLFVFNPGWNFGYNICKQCNKFKDIEGCDELRTTGVHLMHGYNGAFSKDMRYCLPSYFCTKIMKRIYMVLQNLDLKYRWNNTIVPASLYRDFPLNETACNQMLLHNLKPLQYYNGMTV